MPTDTYTLTRTAERMPPLAGNDELSGVAAEVQRRLATVVKRAVAWTARTFPQHGSGASPTPFAGTARSWWRWRASFG